MLIIKITKNISSMISFIIINVNVKGLSKLFFLICWVCVKAKSNITKIDEQKKKKYIKHKSNKKHESSLEANPITLAVNSTNFDPQEREGKIFQSCFLQLVTGSLVFPPFPSSKWLTGMIVSRRNINPIACYRVINWLKGTKNTEYFSSEIISVLKNIFQNIRLQEWITMTRSKTWSKG